MKEMIPREMIEQRIFLIRGHKVMLSTHDGYVVLRGGEGLGSGSKA